MPQINASLPLSPHRNRTPTPFDCCVIHGWCWFMPLGMPYSNMYPRTDVTFIQFVYKNWRGTTKPSPTIVIVAIIPSMGCIWAMDKRVVASVFTGMSSDGGLVYTSCVSTIAVGRWTVGVWYVYGLGRRHWAIRTVTDTNGNNGCNGGVWMESREEIMRRNGGIGSLS